MADLVSIGFKADAKGIDDVNKGFDKVVASGGRADKVLKNTEKSITKFSGAAAKTTDKMSMFGRQSGQAGIQLQQFIGQVQGGQSAMLALSQQSADLGFVLGAPLLGAVVGISASIAGMLLPNLFKATEGIIGLDDSLSFLEGNYKKLSEAQKLVAKDVVSAKLKEQQVQANGLRVEINKLQTALMVAEQSAGGRFLERLFGEDVDKASKALAEAEGSLSTLNLKIEKTKKQVTDLSLAQDKQSESATSMTEAFQSQIIALKDGEEAALRYGIAQSLGIADAKDIPKNISNQVTEIFRLTESKKEAAKAEALLKSEQAKSSAEQVKQEQSLQQLSLGLAEQIIQLQMTSDEYEIYNAKMTAIANGATPEMVAAIENQVKTIQKLRTELKGDGDVELGGNLDSLIGQVDKFGDAWSNTAGTIAQAMGDIVGGLDAYSSKMEKITEREKTLRAQKELSTATSADKLRIDNELADLSDQSTRAQLSGMAQISGAASSLFAEQSKERKALHKMEQVYTAIEIGLALQKAGANALTAITASFAAPFPVNFAAGAAMIGIMAGLGVFSGSGGGRAPTSAELQATQGTGTTLGDSDAKSESIINALEEYNDIGTDQLSELVGIRKAMSNLASGIENLAVSLVTSSSFGGGNVELQSKNFLDTSAGSFFRKIDPVALVLDGLGLGGLADSIFAGFSSTKQKLLDTGLQFGEQTLSDLLADGIQGTYYNVIETTKKKLWGLSKKVTEKTEFSDVEESILSEFTSIFAFIGETVTESLESLGVDAAGTFEDLEIDLGSLSFKDLSGDEIQAELEAIFSQQGDLIAEYMLPQIKQFQDMGEGALEALTRVAKEQAYFNDAIDTMGLSLGDLSNLMRIDVAQAVLDLMGGLEAFSEATNSYVENFFSDSEKMEMLGSSLSDVFDGLAVPMVDTTDGFRDLVASLDLTTLAGQEMFATLMSISPAMAEYIEMLDDQRIDGIQQEIDASRTYHEIELDFLSDRKSALNDMISGLSGASRNLRSVIDVDTNALSTDLAAALSAAQSGNFNPAMALGDISSLMGDSSQFSSAAQMRVSQGVTGFAANELANLVDNQLSVEERTLALLEQQTIDENMRYDAEQAMLAKRIEKENDYADAQTAALDAQLNNTTNQINALYNINSSVLSVQEAISQLQETVANAEAAQANRDAQIAKQTRKTADGIKQINAVGVQTEAIA